MVYCRHDMPADTCALCAPRRPITIHLIACGDYDEGPHTVGGKVCVHRPDCYSATPHEGAQRPYPPTGRQGNFSHRRCRGSLSCHQPGTDRVGRRGKSFTFPARVRYLHPCTTAVTTITFTTEDQVISGGMDRSIRVTRVGYVRASTSPDSGHAAQPGARL